MTTRTDSFDRSPLDAFVQSECDARNMPGWQAHKLVIIADVMHGQSMFPITWDDLRDLPPEEMYHYHVTYLTGPETEEAPFYRFPGPVGNACWAYDNEHWAACQAFWGAQSPDGMQLKLGLVHRREWIPSLGIEFPLPLSPADPPGILQGYRQASPRADRLHAAQDVTRQLLASDEEYTAIILWTANSDYAYPLDLRAYANWASEEYPNVRRIRRPDGSDVGGILTYEGHAVVPVNDDYREPRWLRSSLSHLVHGLEFGWMGWPQRPRDGYIPPEP